MWPGAGPVPAGHAPAAQAGSTGPGGSSQLSDMHARWSEKGAQEFVPKGLNAAPGYTGMHPTQMAAPWSGSPMTNGMRMPMPHWAMAANGGPPHDTQWSVPGISHVMDTPPGHALGNNMHPLVPQQSQTLPSNESAAPLKPNTFVVAWNLSPNYTREKLENELFEIDFHPKKCKDVVDGAFLLEFLEEWHADALIVSLDDTEEHLAPCEGERLRLAKLAGSDSLTWMPREPPSPLRRALPRLLQAECSVFIIGAHEGEEHEQV
uniref:Uncharacterized protein n=1 Tax=Alexandrium monilatum TaxID=311494 RepID=A0A7S4PXP3_9DINO